MAPKPETRWQVDRHIPVALIFSIATFCIIQTITLVIWGATLTTRVSTLEEQVKSQANILGPMVERSIRLETRLESVNANISEVKAILSRSSILTYIPGQPLPDDPRPMKPALTR